MRRHIQAFVGATAGLMLASAPALAVSIDFIDLETRVPAASAPVATPTRESAQPEQGAVPREVVAWTGTQAPGNIVVSTEERRLYLVPATGTVEIDGTRVKARDGAAIHDEARLRITALEDSELVLVDAA